MYIMLYLLIAAAVAVGAHYEHVAWWLAALIGINIGALVATFVERRPVRMP